MSSPRDYFQAWQISPGEENLDYDVDFKPWLAGTAALASVELEQDADDPVLYESPVQLFDGGRLFKLVADCPEQATAGNWFVKVKLTDTQGRVGRQWFQMTVG
jgi:hypothetical protein